MDGFASPPTDHVSSNGPNIGENASASKRRVVGAAMSCLIPGAGQFFINDRRRGILFLTLFVALLLLFWPLRVPGKFGGLVGVVWWMILLFAASPSSALLSKRSPEPRVSKWWFLLVVPLIYGGLNLDLWLFLRASGFKALQTPTSSMQPTVVKGDRFMIDEWAFRRAPIKVNDVVVFRHDGILLIKRVVAVGGDVVHGDANVLIVNGKVPNEPFAIHDANLQSEVPAFGPLTVPAEQLFVVGDNRDLSFDCRFSTFSPVRLSDVIGRPLYVYLSIPIGRQNIKIN
jgi:signal peptidase I